MATQTGSSANGIMCIHFQSISIKETDCFITVSAKKVSVEQSNGRVTVLAAIFARRSGIFLEKGKKQKRKRQKRFFFCTNNLFGGKIFKCRNDAQKMLRPGQHLMNSWLYACDVTIVQVCIRLYYTDWIENHVITCFHSMPLGATFNNIHSFLWAFLN